MRLPWFHWQHISLPFSCPQSESLVSLSHPQDTPQTLEDSYDGFLGPKIVDDFVNYADVLFSNFGDRIANWMTFNEPISYCNLGVRE